MGVYDREYYQEERPPTRIGFSDRMMVTNLVILNVGIFLVDTFLGGSHWLMRTLELGSADLAKPWLWWKFLTYGFAHAPYPELGHIFWNMIGLWIFGRDVELIYGRREFLRVYVGAILLGSVVWSLRCVLGGASHLALLGASGAVTAIVLLFVFHYPKRTILLMFVLPVPAWVVGVLIIGGNLLEMVSSAGQQAIAFDVHLAGAAFAILYFRFGWNLGSLFPDLSGLRSPLKALRPRPHLRLHDPDEEVGGDDEVGDEILRKVGRDGMDSLTPKERRVLEAYSRRMRQKHRSD